MYREGMKSSTPNPEHTMTRLAIIGPNLTAAQQKLGSFHVHAEGCADIARKYKVAAHEVWAVDLDSKTAVIEAVYADQIEEDPDNTIDSLASDFHFCPCVKDLPFAAPAAESTPSTEGTTMTASKSQTAAEKKAAKTEADRLATLAAAEKEAASEDAAIATAELPDSPVSAAAVLFGNGKTIAQIARQLRTNHASVREMLDEAKVDYSADKNAAAVMTAAEKRKAAKASGSKSGKASTPKATKAARPEGFDKAVALFVRSADTPTAFSFVGSFDAEPGKGASVIDAAIKKGLMTEDDRTNAVFARTSCFWAVAK